MKEFFLKWKKIILIIVFLILVILAIVFSNLSKNVEKNRVDLMDIKSYYAEYLVEVYSNKNQNTYKLKEWYRNKNDQKLEYTVENSNKVTFVQTDKDVILKSDKQNLEYVFNLSEVALEKNNYTLKDYIDEYLDKNTRKYKYQKENRTIYEIVKENRKRTLEIDENNLPVSITNEDENGKIISKVKIEKISELGESND